jgi:hypothetical protein
LVPVDFAGELALTSAAAWAAGVVVGQQGSRDSADGVAFGTTCISSPVGLAVQARSGPERARSRPGRPEQVECWSTRS